MSQTVEPGKRIWQVDCVSLDAALAASFEWKDLNNILAGFKVPVLELTSSDAMAIEVHNKVHRYCHSENEVSLTVERILNYLHKDIKDKILRLSREDAYEFVMRYSFRVSGKMGGIFWALGSDPREDFSCLRRRFQQRFQLLSIKHLLSSREVQPAASSGGL